MKAVGKALVASGHAVVSGAAMQILKKGGNAFDAAVAAGFAGAVAEPALTSLGGGGFLLARTSDGEEILFDFFVDTPGRGGEDNGGESHFFPVTVHFPGSDQDFNVGLASIATPGCLKGFLHVHRRLGRLSLSEVVAPAVKAARQGVMINRHQGYFLDLLKPIMTMTGRGRDLYAVDGRYPVAGDTLCNLDLADFLAALPDDMGKDFYQGRLAGMITADMEKGGGLLTKADLTAYRVIERSPLAFSYRGRRCLTNPPPSFGGSLIAGTLRRLDKTPLAGTAWGTAEHITALASVLEEVESARRAGHPPPAFSRGTTHVSVSDASGNVAAMSTSNGEGSGYIVPGTGIMLNNMMGEDDLHPGGFHAAPPGLRVASMMSPAILLENRRILLTLGSGGSKRIRTALTQVISNVLDFGLDVKTAVDAPRIHWDGEVMQVEPGLASETLAALRARWPVNVWRTPDVYFGGVHAISNKNGAGDPRRGGDARQSGKGAE